ncbi:IclR family transcriptional regulator [Roseomonas sp. E05]|uniref:IclR family transcriptional regulator n=1 Tax=Roseomonas sp. E05 TaxID=3046310 RepID=UPI0024BA65D9|nr:IclR family transcriptional regulator [Roseomonas sp. E05]MDJ0390750.1 IclR family transcriptional regulator [Roseomonas sp. E05]
MREDALLVGSVEKAFRVLHAVREGPGAMSLSEIAAASGLDKSAAQRFSHTLWRLGYLEKDERTRRFSLGRQALETAFHYLRTTPLVEVAMPVVAELRRSCGERVSMSLWEDTSLIYVIRQQSRREYFWSSLVGRRVPLVSTAGGRAILASLAAEEAEALVRRATPAALTPRTLTDPAAILEQVRQARAQGYAMATEEVSAGEVTLGAAITRADGRPVAALHIAGSLSEWKPEAFAASFAPLLLEAAQGLSRAGGSAARAGR